MRSTLNYFNFLLNSSMVCLGLFLWYYSFDPELPKPKDAGALRILGTASIGMSSWMLTILWKEKNDA